MTEDDWRAVVDDDLTATFLPLKSFLPGMQAARPTRAILDVAGGSVMA
jgi:NAD(P)-dependent dehydrogenase (short-subunit alcohol dehydrogenase family)